ncbi:MAG TPA: tRNA adenosine(34) deaminase TadA [bacterium]|nr:tRNA adenosine(34) deaminase TadA [bacterium]
MGEALTEAEAAARLSDVPIGAVVVREGRVIARGRNRREVLRDPTAHAELNAVRQAAKILGGWRLLGCTLYVTLEPCVMCAGALVQARLPRLVYGAPDPKAGGAGSVVDLLRDSRFNHAVEVFGGVREAECGALLRGFFAALRR